MSNIIETLESDLNQAREYGGIPVHCSRSELRKILAALKIGQKLAVALSEAQDDNELISQWRHAINNEHN